MPPRFQRRRRPRRPLALDSLPYASKVFLVTNAERAFFHALREALEPHLHICPKVRVADIIGCSDDEWRHGFGGAISQKHLDFVLAHPKSLRVALAIELDDRSHLLPSRQKRDAFLEAALRTAGVPLLRYEVRADYFPDAIRKRVFATLRRARRISEGP